MKILALDPGFAATGAVVMEWKGNVWWPAEMKCIRTTKDDAKLGVRVAEQDVTRVQETARALVDIIDRHQIKMMVVELPHGGAQSSRAVRAMALSTGLIAGLVEYFGLAVEWLTPDDTRIAAVGSRKATKDQVMAGMAVRYPALNDIKTKAEKEHIADAMSCFRAAELAGNLVRLAINGGQ